MTLASPSLPTCLLLASTLLAAACGDDRGTGASASASGSTSATTLPPTSTGVTTEQPTTGESASGTMSASAGVTTGDVSAGSGGSSGGSGPKFDLGGQPDSPPVIGCGGDGMGMPAFSYIWIANSVEGTVSKIDAVKAANSGEYGGIQRVA